MKCESGAASTTRRGLPLIVVMALGCAGGGQGKTGSPGAISEDAAGPEGGSGGAGGAGAGGSTGAGGMAPAGPDAAAAGADARAAAGAGGAADTGVADASGVADGSGSATPPSTGATVCINADGQGSADGKDTYDLLESVFGQNCIENPDADHSPLYRHVKEEMDPEVGPHFAVHVHKDDSDMGRDNGKNRVEIKVHGGATDALKATDGETLTYTWRFKMPEDMVYSPRFNAMFQFKSFGGNAGLPLINIKVAPSGGSDKLIVEYIGDGGGAVRHLATAPLAGIKGVWLQVFCRAEFKNAGSVFMTIKRLDGTSVVSIDEKGLDMWRQGDYIRPKWGLYRGKAANTRALEIVRFANFGITAGPTPSTDCTRP